MTDATRQYGSLESIREDHVNRYRFAAERARREFTSGIRILDAACGCGYGSKILEEIGVVVGVDIEQKAIEYAEEHYGGPRYIQGSILDKPWGGMFEVITSFETIEHLEEPLKALKLFRDSLDGYLFVSVPNEIEYPFCADTFSGDAYPHRRHYTPDELDELLKSADFTVLERYCQKNKRPGEVEAGVEGKFLVYVCR